MAISTLSSPLSSVANKIISVNSKSGTSLVRAQSEYKKFGDFLDFKRQELERTSLPDDKKIQKLANINVVNTFGSAGGLLGGLLGGALDVGGLVRGFFPGEGKKVGAAPQAGKPKTKPVIKSGKLRLGGIRALGVANALFSGLDFATGLAEGESVGKSAAGTSGALAGSLLGGAIGQALIPIPGVGFIIGSAAGGLLGGYGADRTYEAVESQRIIKAKQSAKLKEQKQAMTRGGKVDKKDNILSKFDDVAKKFEGFVSGIVGGVAGAIISGFGSKDMPMEWDTEYPESSFKNDAKGEYQDLEVSGGIDPSTVTMTSAYGWRWGRMHNGTDFGVNSGTPISVIQPGVVEYSGWASGGAGNSVYINHPDGAKTVYFHLLNPSPLKNGQSITAGTFIGEVGMSGGTSTGPHLHFEYYPPGSNKRIDPLPYASKYFRFGGNVKVKPKTESQVASTPTSTNISNSNIPNNKSKLQSDVEGFRQFRNQNFGASKSRVATTGPQNFQIREMGIPGNKGYQINPLADDTNYEISRHKGAGHLENRAFDIPVPDTKSGDKVNQYWTSRGYKTLWRVKGHFDHVHVEIPRDKVQEFTKIYAQSQVNTPPPKPRDVSYQLPYNQQRQTAALIIDRPSAIIAAGGGGSSRPTVIPSSSGGGGTIVVASSTYQAERNTLNKLQELALV